MRYETTRKIEDLKAYYRGLKDGVQMYAHWNDGVQYVGTTGKTLADAIKELNKAEELRIDQIKESNENL